MRTWTPQPASQTQQALLGAIDALGQPAFASRLLESLGSVVPAASCAIYRTGARRPPQLFMSASRGIPDTTRQCWQAYLGGPYRSDRTFGTEATPDAGTLLCHITAAEVPPLHRARIYEAHGMVERVSVVQHEPDGLFAINFYRHDHQRPFSDAQIGDFGALAPALLSLTRRQIALHSLPAGGDTQATLQHWHVRLRQQAPDLSPRELEVCSRLLLGMTQDGIADELGLRLPTVKTYRNRAFARLGIHFRSELFALMQRA